MVVGRLWEGHAVMRSTGEWAKVRANGMGRGKGDERKGSEEVVEGDLGFL